MKCGQVKLSQYKHFQQKDQFNWICPACLLSVLPFADVSILTDDNAHVEFDNPANTTTHGTDRNIPTFYGDFYTKLKGHGLKIAHLNVRSLLGKISEIKLSESKLDILAISETHLDDETPIEYVMIPGYQVARLDRKDQEGGGCIIYYSESLHVYERDDLKTDIEAIWIDVTIKSQKLLLGCVYRPPDDYSFYNKFYTLLEHSLRNRKNVVILGDLNSDLITKGYEGRRLLRILGSLDLYNVIKDPTRTTVTTSTLLDLMITTDVSKIMSSGTFDPGLSDHCLIYGIIRLQRKRTAPKYISAKNYRQVNVETLKHAFTTAPWSAIEAFDDPDDIAWAWETLYKDIVNDHNPQRRVKIRSESLPWMNSHIRKTMNKRYNILKRAKETGSKELWEEYKKLRNEVTKLLREAEAKYWRQEFKKHRKQQRLLEQGSLTRRN